MPDVTLDVLTKFAAKTMKVVSVAIASKEPRGEDGNHPEPLTFYLGEFDAHEIDTRLFAFNKNLEALEGVRFDSLLIAASLCDKDRRWLVDTTDQILTLAKQLEKGLSGVDLHFLAKHAQNLNMFTDEQLSSIEKKLQKTPTNDASGG